MGFFIPFLSCFWHWAASPLVPHCLWCPASCTPPVVPPVQSVSSPCPESQKRARAHMGELCRWFWGAAAAAWQDADITSTTSAGVLFLCFFFTICRVTRVGEAALRCFSRGPATERGFCVAAVENNCKRGASGALHPRPSHGHG